MRLITPTGAATCGDEAAKPTTTDDGGGDDVDSGDHDKLCDDNGASDGGYHDHDSDFAKTPTTTQASSMLAPTSTYRNMNTDMNEYDLIERTITTTSTSTILNADLNTNIYLTIYLGHL